MRGRRLLLAAVVAALLAAPLGAWAQATEVVIGRVLTDRYAENGRVTMLVELRNLPGSLDPNLISVSEDGQPVTGLEGQLLADSAVAQGIVLVVDSSGSMAGAPIEAAKAAARDFVSQKRPEDQIAVVAFSDTPRILSGFTDDAAALTAEIDGIDSGGNTAMYDAVVTGAELFAGVDPSVRRTMIVLTDGQDDGSAGTLDAAKAAVAAQGVRTFGVALESPEFNPADVADLAASSGGLFLSTPDPQELSGLYGQISRELSNTLVLRFTGNRTEAGESTYTVSYGDVGSASTAVSVPGYVPATAAPETTVETFVQAQPVVVESPLVAPPLVLILLATLGVAAAVGVFAFILLGGTRTEQVADFTRRLAQYGRRGPKEERRTLLERIPFLSRFTAAAEERARRRGLLGAINTTLEQGNVPLAPGEAIAAAIGLALVLGLVSAVVTFSVVIGVVVLVGTLVLAYGVVNFIGNREKRKFENQLPDTLVLLATSMRAGYSLLQAVEAVAQEAPNPTAREFQRSIAEARLGVPVVDALRGITRRTQSADFEWAVMAIEIQREVGGNLSEVLQTVADTMHARNRLKGEIRAMTAEGRISAIVLGLLPVALGLFLWTTNPGYLAPLFENTLGLVAVGVGVLLMGAGFLWLRKIIDIEV